MTFACAHRGLSAEKPENTLAAFGAAVAAGFQAVEMDLRTTKDGEVVILHDPTLDRTTMGKGPLADATWQQVQQVGDVPRLADLFTTLKAWDGFYNLEVKAATATRPMLELAEKRKLAQRCLVSSMDLRVLQEAKRIAPAVARAFIPFGPVDDQELEACLQAGCAWINVDHDFLDPDEMARFRAAGLKVGTWTVNDVPRARELAAMGVDCIITDTRAVHESLAPKATAATF
ncbi:MAG: glycerophosphoryl diester phosphodiesterase [Thermoplasmata archaeon]|jgi:glycerophosphoryl diester phosphodiesterase|nr:glycerophosphoryl diester phosphodiesterase [Thermoplasmata archaeon]